LKIQFDVPPSSPQESNGLSVRYAASKRQVPRWRWYLLLAMVLTPPAYLLGRFAISYWWENTPGLVVTEQTVLRAISPGQVVTIANVGDRLKAGQSLMEVKKDDPAGNASGASVPPTPEPTALAAAPSSSSTSVREPLAERLASQEAIHRLAQQQLTLQQERLQTLQSLRAEGAATRGEVDSAQAQVYQAQAEANRTKAAAQETRLALAQARVATPLATVQPTVKTEVTSGQRPSPGQNAAPAVMKAPFDVVVVRQLVRPGEHVEAGTDVAVVQGTSKPPLVHAYLPPNQARYAQAGRLATLHFMDGRSVRAEVQDVISEAERTPAERVSPLTPRMPSIVVRLRPLEELPPGYRIHYLPLDVRFDWVWGGW
jgi:multidrug resistance efflux pump